MKFSLSWLKKYLDTNANIETIADQLTNIGLEVEKVTDLSAALKDFTVAKIISAEKHLEADKLRVCKVDSGSNVLNIVCGAKNARAGIKVVLAKEGVIIPANGMKIKKSKIRGVESNGMLCSAEELGLGEDSEGIIELPENAKIGEEFAQFLNFNDPVIEIDITPNRGDCLGVKGIARDLAASGLGVLKKEEPKKTEAKVECSIKVKANVENSAFYGREIKNVNNIESPEWLKNQLTAIGLNPVSALVDISNYINYDLCRPSHIYNLNKISDELIIRKANKGEKIVTLDEQEYELDDSIIVISDKNKAQAIAGIMGGVNSKCPDVNNEKMDIFIEMAYFDPVDIAKAGRKLMLESDSRYRFERYVDPESIQNDLDIMTEMILDICGGEASEIICSKNLSYEKNKIELQLDSVKRLLSIDIKQSEIENILLNLGFKIENNNECLVLTPPSWRNDLTIEQDVIEEIARIYGYNNIPEKSFDSNAINPFSREDLRLRKIKNILSANGLKQNISYSFVSEKLAKTFQGNTELIYLENAITEDLAVMRPSILASLFKNYASNYFRNKKNETTFEIGNVFSKKFDQLQTYSISGIRAGQFCEESFYKENREVNVFDTKGDAENILKEFINIESLNIERSAPNYYHPGRSGAFLLGKNVIAYFGQIHPKILQENKIKTNIVGFEIFVDKLPKLKNKKSIFSAYIENNLPNIERDFAFIIQKDIEVGNITKSIKRTDKEIIKSVKIFDIYEGEKIDSKNKSVAFKVTLQPKNKTFSEEEIQIITKRIIDNVENNYGATLRS